MNVVFPVFFDFQQILDEFFTGSWKKGEMKNMNIIVPVRIIDRIIHVIYLSETSPVDVPSLDFPFPLECFPFSPECLLFAFFTILCSADSEEPDACKNHEIQVTLLYVLYSVSLDLCFCQHKNKNGSKKTSRKTYHSYRVRSLPWEVDDTRFKVSVNVSYAIQIIQASDLFYTARSLSSFCSFHKRLIFLHWKPHWILIRRSHDIVFCWTF